MKTVIAKVQLNTIMDALINKAIREATYFSLELFSFFLIHDGV